MTGPEFHAIRKRLGLSRTRMGRALGYQGGPNTLNVQIAVYESGRRPIPEWIARLALMYDRYGVPDDLAA